MKDAEYYRNKHREVCNKLDEAKRKTLPGLDDLYDSREDDRKELRLQQVSYLL